MQVYSFYKIQNNPHKYIMKNIDELQVMVDLYKQEAEFWKGQFFQLSEIVSKSKRGAVSHIDKIKKILGYEY